MTTPATPSDSDRSLAAEFAEDALESLREVDLGILKLQAGTPQPALVDHLFRLVHSIKGNAGFFGGFHAVRRLAHLTEDILDSIRRAGGQSGPEELALVTEGSRVLAQALDAYLRDGGDPATSGGAEDAFARKVRAFRTPALSEEPGHPREGGGPPAEPGPSEREATVKVEAAGLRALGDEIAVVRDGLAELGQRDPIAQFWKERTEGVLRMLGELRSVPLHRLFDRLPGIVRALSERLGKSVAVETDGGELRVARALAETVELALVHLLRNSLDHGIERQELRLRRGKPVVGRVAVRACQAGARLLLNVEDDGGGIDPRELRMVAVARKLMSEAEAAALTDEQAIALVFRPGFSTAPAASEVSGRGVGMDAVLTAVRKVGGEVTVQSNPRRGTIVILDLPTEPRLS